MPWLELEETYAPQFSSNVGASAKPVRLAFGSLYIKQRLGLTDEETVLQIQEKHYIQFFLGFAVYSSKAPFDLSMMVHFRRRFSDKDLRRINEIVVQRGKAMLIEAVTFQQDNSDGSGGDDSGSCDQLALDSLIKPVGWPEGMNWGTLSIDASCTPADITYPTDLKLLNEAMQSTEGVVDDLCKYCSAFTRCLPRYDRRKAQAHFLNIAK
jgi:IS5 family transposase